MLNFFKVSGDNATDTLYSLLRNLNAKVTWETVRETMLQHPDSPSLLSLSEVLSGWNIDNAALQLNTVEQLREIPVPFITQIKKKGGWYILINQIREKHIQYTDSEQGEVTLSLSDFEKRWTGIVLLTEINEQSGEVDYDSKRLKEQLRKWRSPFVSGATLLVLFSALMFAGRSFSTPEWLLFFTKISGLFFTGLLIAKQLGSKNDLTDRLCRINDKTSCENVLNSPGAKLFGWLNWSDLGLLYFAGGSSALLFTGEQHNEFNLLNALALLAMPYVAFSIYYQAYKVRQWCTLCLGVQVILIVEGVIALTQLKALPGHIQPYLVLLIGFLLPTIAWVIIKPLLDSRTQIRREHEELLALKRDPAIFKTLLIQQPQSPPISADIYPLVLGNPDAEIKITMVTNPYCSSCSRAHKELEQLVLQDENVSVTTIFSTTGDSSPATKVVTHLLALARHETSARSALTEWYSQKEKDYNAWAKSHPTTTDPTEMMAICRNQRLWCHEADIALTPTIYINGYKMPEIYKLESLQWILKRVEFDKVLESNV
ncbi:vitamin K epoxide reductase family protein [Dyadobacter fermentans]|uniref:Peptidase C39 bacteriocin processing n=1 Tax=Dyadobacter fermentans (strain ATCC 700827 / DSM 18053 / CIP 107007 / KCTC 52180 / NS114) TaxID=471854 RepID=C6VT77_DYAFD|nr:vitamin K epoxide reductase family protein [Dyadobacter fermentans]ACT96441.1 peptidase C39 bacteriocin processing [Dyadobacter fermentans DSM 18053]